MMADRCLVALGALGLSCGLWLLSYFLAGAFYRLRDRARRRQTTSRESPWRDEDDPVMAEVLRRCWETGNPVRATVDDDGTVTITEDAPGGAQ